MKPSTSGLTFTHALLFSAFSALIGVRRQNPSCRLCGREQPAPVDPSCSQRVRVTGCAPDRSTCLSLRREACLAPQQPAVASLSNCEWILTRKAR